MDWLDDNEDVSKEDTILDLGCGNGALLLELVSACMPGRCPVLLFQLVSACMPGKVLELVSACMPGKCPVLLLLLVRDCVPGKRPALLLLLSVLQFSFSLYHDLLICATKHPPTHPPPPPPPQQFTVPFQSQKVTAILKRETLGYSEGMNEN